MLTLEITKTFMTSEWLSNHTRTDQVRVADTMALHWLNQIGTTRVDYTGNQYRVDDVKVVDQ